MEYWNVSELGVIRQHFIYMSVPIKHVWNENKNKDARLFIKTCLRFGRSLNRPFVNFNRRSEVSTTFILYKNKQGVYDQIVK